MSDRILRWGVLSTANIGRAAVVPALHASPRSRVEAVASRDQARARQFAEANRIPRGVGSYQALLDDPEIDAVYIPLPNSLHLEWTRKAAEAGKHVLCEKPLGLGARECLEMDRVARVHDVRLMEAFMYRFHPRSERLLEMVGSGALGDLRMIRSTFTFRLTRPDNIRLDPGLGGGALLDVGCYCVNVSRMVAGREPLAVQATARWSERGVDEELTGTLFFEGGLVARFDCALTMERCEQVEVAGTDAWLRIPQAFLPGTNDCVIEEHRGRSGREDHLVPGADEYLRMVEHFEDAVLDGLPLRYDAREAARNLKVIEAIYVSARAQGARVDLDREAR
ncbi:MAG: Gfo/Idh/MocA family oxidoreductase [Gemmatimonadota bacterium]